MVIALREAGLSCVSCCRLSELGVVIVMPVRGFVGGGATFFLVALGAMVLGVTDFF